MADSRLSIFGKTIISINNNNNNNLDGDEFVSEIKDFITQHAQDELKFVQHEEMNIVGLKLTNQFDRDERDACSENRSRSIQWG